MTTFPLKRPVLWGDLVHALATRDGVLPALAIGAPLLLGFGLLTAPVVTLGALCAAALFWMLWKHPFSAVTLFICFMGNVKINYYAGFFTVFPEYLPIAFVGLIMVLKWAEGSWRLEEPGLVAICGGFLLAGLLSAVSAIDTGRVVMKTLLTALEFVVFYIVATEVRTKRHLERALNWVEGASCVMAAYGIFQMIGGFFGLDTRLGLQFIEKYGNQDFHYGIGAPVVYQFSSIFRANSLFNDSNILAGYLASCVPIVLALLLYHAEAGRRRRATVDGFVLIVLMTCLLFTLSRSGFLAVACGVGVVIASFPAVLKRAGFWATIGLGLGVAIGVSKAIGIDPFLLIIRLTDTFAVADVSTRTHRDVAVFALRLFARSPLFGGGLNNFGLHYGSEVDAHYASMMAHSAPFEYLGETGLLGFSMFVLLAGTCLWRPWRALRDRRLPACDPHLRALLVGAFAALAALYTANLFYDYYQRTFVWVLSGLAIAAARIATDRVRNA